MSGFAQDHRDQGDAQQGAFSRLYRAGRRGVTVTTLLLILWLTGCGVKGPPVAPDVDLPKPVYDLQAYVKGEELVFTWMAPNDKRRAKISGYKLFFEDADQVTKCDRPCRKFRELVFVDEARLDTDFIRNGRVELRLPVRPEYLWKTYGYVVVPVSSEGYAGNESREITMHWTPAPPAPVSLKARPGDHSVSLEWTSKEDSTPRYFNVYRRGEDEAFPLIPVNPSPLLKDRYFDKEVQNGVRYYYEARALDSRMPPWIESEPSPEVEVLPMDLSAPQPPVGVEVIPGKGIIRIFWEESREGDIRGYRIYRRAGKGSGFKPIGETRHPVTIFTDKDVKVGGVYDYFVAAYDQASVPNESGPSKIVTAHP